MMQSCVYRKSDSTILVMKAAKDGPWCDDAEVLNRPMKRGILRHVHRSAASSPTLRTREGKQSRRSAKSATTLPTRSTSPWRSGPIRRWDWRWHLAFYSGSCGHV